MHVNSGQRVVSSTAFLFTQEGTLYLCVPFLARRYVQSMVRLGIGFKELFPVMQVDLGSDVLVINLNY